MTIVMLSTLGAATCSLPDASAGTKLDYKDMKGYVVTQGDERFARFAPIFLVEKYSESYNRVGAPSARLADDGHEDVYVDPAKPVFYTQVKEWDSPKGHYTNLIYRVHFEMSKGNSNSTNGGKGYNVGMMAVVTLDGNNQPVLLNAVHTCGCFHTILPTSFLPEADYPEGWDVNRHSVYKENLPGLIHYPKDYDESIRPVIYLRDGSHRVADIEIGSIASVKEKYALIDAPMAPMDALYHLPLGKGETSFFYTEGKNKGLVKGAYKKKEMILAPLIGDSRVGQDRAYGSKDDVPRGFYTTLDPTEKDNSDMWDYAKFLESEGWKL